MASKLAKALVAVAFPVVVFVGVNKLQSWDSGRDQALRNAAPPNPTPLNLRLAYDEKDVDGFWGALGKNGRVAEQRFLEEDLVFPTFYGGALAISLLWVLSMTRLKWPRWLVVLSVVAGVAGDWRENLIQLDQLRRYGEFGKAGLQGAVIHSASLATDVKLAGITIATVLLLALVAIWLKQPAGRQSQSIASAMT